MNIYDYVVFKVLIAVVVKSTIFWNMTPCSPSSVNRRFGGIYRLKMEAICSSVTSVDTQRTTLQGEFYLPPACSLVSC
jgi:hypothetical protein